MLTTINICFFTNTLADRFDQMNETYGQHVMTKMINQLMAFLCTSWIEYTTPEIIIQFSLSMRSADLVSLHINI